MPMSFGDGSLKIAPVEVQTAGNRPLADNTIDWQPSIKPQPKSAATSLSSRENQPPERHLPPISASTQVNQGLEHISAMGAAYGAVKTHNQVLLAHHAQGHSDLHGLVGSGANETFVRAKQDFSMALGRQHKATLDEINVWRQNHPGIVRELKARPSDPHSERILAPAIDREIPPALSESLERLSHITDMQRQLAQLRPESGLLNTNFSRNRWVQNELLPSAEKLDEAATHLGLEHSMSLKKGSETLAEKMRSAGLTAAGGFAVNYLVDQTFFSRSSPGMLTYATDIGSTLIFFSQRSNLQKAGVMVGAHMIAKVME